MKKLITSKCKMKQGSRSKMSSPSIPPETHRISRKTFFKIPFSLRKTNSNSHFPPSTSRTRKNIVSLITFSISKINLSKCKIAAISYLRRTSSKLVVSTSRSLSGILIMIWLMTSSLSRTSNKYLIQLLYSFENQEI